MIKLGDKVKFINENMQGVVTSINGNTAGVTIEDDFEIPVMINEIVKINEVLNKPKAEQEKPITVKPNFVKIHHGIHIAFEEISEDKFDLKIHNSDTDCIMVAYYQNKELNNTLFIDLETTKSLGIFKLSEFNTWPEFAFIITPISNNFKQNITIAKKIKFSAKEFHAGFKQCYFLAKQAYTFRLDTDVTPQSLVKLAQKDFSESTPSTQTKTLINLNAKPQSEVDLHVQCLTENPALLSAHQMIDLQMDAVRLSLEMAHVHKMKTITFIHGVGNHFLKNKIKNYLTAQKPIVSKYQDADALKYGGGATEVFLK